MKSVSKPCCTSSATRKAMMRPVLAPARARTSIRAMAYNKDSTEHQKRLKATAQEFLSHWIDGCREGATEQVMSKLSKLVDDDVAMQTAHPLGNDKGKGLTKLKDLLNDGTHSNVTKVEMIAVSAETDTAFALVECEDSTVDEVATAGGIDYRKTVRKTYGIIKLNMAFDEADNSWMTMKVTGISERTQNEPADSCMMAVLEPSHRLPSYSAREKEGFEALKLAGTWHFPTQHIVENNFLHRGIDYKAAEASIQKWCAARCSDFNEAQLVPEAVDVENFHLWDGYGVLPTACNYNAGALDQIAKDRPAAKASCLLPTELVLELIKSSKSKNKMRCTLVDHAMVGHNNVGFSHWRTHVRPKENPDARFILEAMAVHVFNDKGKILDTWMLRDATPLEKKVMSSANVSPDSPPAEQQPESYGSFRPTPDAPKGPSRIIPTPRIQRV